MRWPELAEVFKMVDWLNNHDLMRYSEQRHKEHTVETQYEYLRSFHYPDVFWSIMAKDTLIGTATAYVDDHNKVANLGILIAESGYGHGTIAWRLCCDYLFERKLRKVEAGCADKNLGMMAICRKAGMFVEGRQVSHFQFEDGLSDLVHWGKFP